MSYLCEFRKLAFATLIITYMLGDTMYDNSFVQFIIMNLTATTVKPFVCNLQSTQYLEKNSL